jgi:hypothetical protein
MMKNMKNRRPNVLTLRLGSEHELLVWLDEDGRIQLKWDGTITSMLRPQWEHLQQFIGTETILVRMFGPPGPFEVEE